MKSFRGQNKKKVVLGVTGSFGSGKSTVARILGSLGAKVIDADKLGHSLLRRSSPVYAKIKLAFKTVERRRLARIVFDNGGALRKLTKILHPPIIRMIKRKIKELPDRVIVLDAPLLIESGLTRIVDKLIVVRISQETQIRRIQRRSKLTQKEIAERIRWQMPLEEKIRRADFVIDNNGSLKETARQVKRLFRKYGEDKWIS